MGADAYREYESAPAPVRRARSLSSTLYRPRESFPDAPSARARAREVSLEPADWVSKATPRMEPVTTAEQYAYALSAFDTARIYGNQAEPGVGPCLDELRAPHRCPVRQRRAGRASSPPARSATRSRPHLGPNRRDRREAGVRTSVTDTGIREDLVPLDTPLPSTQPAPSSSCSSSAARSSSVTR